MSLVEIELGQPAYVTRAQLETIQGV